MTLQSKKPSGKLKTQAPALEKNMSQDTYTLLITTLKFLGQRLELKFSFPPFKENQSISRWLELLCLQSGLRMRKIHLTGSWWKKDLGLLLGFYANYPCLLKPGYFNKYNLLKPNGKTFLSIKTQENLLGPHAIIFIKPLPEDIRTLGQILRFSFRVIKRSLFQALFIQILLTLSLLSIPISLGYFFNHIDSLAKSNALVQISFIMVINASLYLLLNINQTLLVNKMRLTVQAKLEAGLWDRLLTIPIQFFQNHSTGRIADKVSGINFIQEILTHSASLTLLSSFVASLSLLLMLYYDAKLTLFALLALLTLGFFFYFLNKKLIFIQRLYYADKFKQSGFIFQVITNIIKFKAAAAEHKAFELWHDSFSDLLHFRYKAGRIKILIKTTNASLLTLLTTLIFCFYHYQLTSISLGDFIAFSTAFTQLFAQFMTLILFMASFSKFIPLFEQSLDIFSYPLRKKAKYHYQTTLKGAITVKNLTFGYPESQDLIYKNLNLEIKPGEIIGITGSSGSGKSTLLRLLLGLEKPSKGDIYFDNINSTVLNPAMLNQQISVVTQRNHLIPGTLLENILGLNTHLTRKDAWDIIYQLGFENIIKAFPMEMETYINEGVQALSGGETQCILLARALVKKPKILFLDEPTSALDNTNQAKIQAYLQSLKITQLIIAHRLSTLKFADKILFIQNGELIQFNDFNTFINANKNANS